MLTTDQRLLDQLKDAPAHRAWELFFQQYWQVILRYGRKLGLAADEAEDVLQETMIDLMRILPEFAYDPERRFRNFLFTIVHRKALLALRRRTRHREGAERAADEKHGAAAGCFPADAPTPREVVEKKAAKLWRESLAEQALEDIQSDGSVEPRTLDIFRAYVLDGRSAGDVAREFDVTVNNVYQIKDRLTRRLRVRVERLMNEMRM